MKRKVVLVSFTQQPCPHLYSYFVPEGLTLKQGDLVVVKTAGEYKIVRVIQTAGIPGPKIDRATATIEGKLKIVRSDT